MVPVFRRFAYRGVDLVVIPQPDGSVACIPEWDDARAGGALQAVGPAAFLP
jgi:hypothetical protein